MAAKAFGISSFTNVGHLIHINLKEHLLPYKQQIGEALLNQNSRALAVVNKVNIIENEFRNFDIEVIAKRPNCRLTDEELMIVEVNENKCRYKFDFSRVYWNSRLSTEHERIIAKFNKNHDIVFDLFAGVGPFSVPAAKAKCKTYANDLNPESVKWLDLNMKRNKVPKDMYELYNMDSKEFILEIMRPVLLEEYDRLQQEDSSIKAKIHIIMNLPALAPSFLPNFSGLLRDDNVRVKKLFKELSIDHIVYCYCFIKGNYIDPRQAVLESIEGEFGRQLEESQILDVTRVRNVATFKDMYRVEIRLDEKILFEPKNLVSIMKNQSSKLNQIPNGCQKKVTIKAPKRNHGELDESNTSNESKANGEATKRQRIIDYCSVM